MMEAKRWNERLRLIMAALNATAIGTFGLGVVAPIVAALTAPDQAGGLDDLPFFGGVVWPAVLVALFLHVCAHIIVSYLEPEKE